MIYTSLGLYTSTFSYLSNVLIRKLQRQYMCEPVEIPLQNRIRLSKAVAASYHAKVIFHINKF